jgi:hypothetical protein
MSLGSFDAHGAQEPSYGQLLCHRLEMAARGDPAFWMSLQKKDESEMPAE